MVIMTFREYDRTHEIMDQLGTPTYYPTMDELQSTIAPNPDKFLLFMEWLLTRPAKTEEEKKVEKLMKRLVQENLKLVNSLKDEEKEET